MESDEARDMARTLERAEAAPYLAYPSLPGWAAPVMGAWFAAIVAALGHSDGLVWKLVTVALLAVEAVFLRWYSRAHGAMPWPGRGNPPAEIGRLYRGYYAGVVGVVLLIALTWWLVGLWSAVAVTFLLSTSGLWLYDQRYRVASAAVRERLA